MWNSLIASLVIAASGQGKSPQDAEVKHAADIRSDVEMGNKIAIEADKRYKPSTDKAAIERVERVGQKLAKIAREHQVRVIWGDPRLNKFDYTFKVVQGEDVNAFSLPGGRIYVLEGLLKYVESDDELAGVLAHEIAHAAFRHVRQLEHEQNKLDILTIPLVLVSILKGGSAAGTGLIFGDLLSTAIGNGWSVKAEQAADLGGYQYLRYSDYNPTGMMTVMERLAANERNSVKIDYGIYRDHPPSKERADTILGEMTKDHIPLQRSLVSSSLRMTSKGSEVYFGKTLLFALNGANGTDRASDFAKNMNPILDNEPELFEFKRQGSDFLFRSKKILTLDSKDESKDSKPMGDFVMQRIRTAVYSASVRVWTN